MPKLRNDVARVLITGANGFIGKNLQLHLAAIPDVEVCLFTRDDMPETLGDHLVGVDIIFHLAGVNRPENPDEFATGNRGLTESLAKALADQATAGGTFPAVVYTSSTQATLDNPYGASKLGAEEALFDLSRAYGYPVFVFRLPNVFGKWSRPNYNSAIATFCHNIARDLPITVNNPAAQLTLVYVDDVMTEFLAILSGRRSAPAAGFFAEVPVTYQATVGEVVESLKSFRSSRKTLVIDPVGTGLTRALYATYVSYLPVDDFSYDIPAHTDSRGTFVEMLKTTDSGQFSYFTAHPGVTRGGHYHHTKTEKFLVVKGEARFGFRHMQTGERHELLTSGARPQVVESVPGWAHDITNVGSKEMLVLLWANEIFDRERPDTITNPI